MASLNKKLAAYSSAAVAVGGAYTGAAHAALVTPVPFAVGENGGINDAGGNPIAYFQEDTPGTAAPNGDTGRYVYLKTNGNTTGSGKDNPSFVASATGNAGVLVNLAPGTVVGPSASTGQIYSTATSYNSSSQNTELNYIDTTTAMSYTPSGLTPDSSRKTRWDMPAFNSTPTAAGRPISVTSPSRSLAPPEAIFPRVVLSSGMTPAPPSLSPVELRCPNPRALD